MSLTEKYNDLVQKAKSINASNLQVREQNNVLYIDGQVTSGQQKDQLWDAYNKIDPDYRAGDLVLNIQVSYGDNEASLSIKNRKIEIKHRIYIYSK